MLLWLKRLLKLPSEKTVPVSYCNRRQWNGIHFSEALNPRRNSSSFIFNIQVFVLNVMFTIKTWAFKNKTLSLHSKSYPVVINPNSNMLKKIED